MNKLKRPVSPGLIIASGSIAFLGASLFRDISIAYFFGGVGYVDLFFVFFGIFEFAQIFCRQTEGGVLPYLNSMAKNSIANLFTALKRYWVSRVFLGTSIVSVLLAIAVYSETLSPLYYVLYGLSIAIAITFFLASGFNCTWSIWMGDWRWYAFQLPSIALVWTLSFAAIKLLGYEKVALPVGLVVACFTFWSVQHLYLKRTNDKPGEELAKALPPEINSSLLVITLDALLTVGMIRLLERTIVFGMGEGVVTSLTFAVRLSFIAWAMFLPAFSLPLFSRAVNGDDIEMKGAVLRSIKNAYLVLAIAYGALIPLLPTICGFLFGHGKFSSGSLEMTSNAVVVYSLAFFGGVFTDILGRIFWANKETLLRLKLQGASLAVYAIVLFVLVNSGIGYMSAPIAWVLYWFFSGFIHTVVAVNKGYIAISIEDVAWFGAIAFVSLSLVFFGKMILGLAVAEIGLIAGFVATLLVLSVVGAALLVAILGRVRVAQIIRAVRPV